MPTAWRLVKPYRIREAFSGKGARLFGGRWNSVGTSVVYTAESKALAALELLVHVDIPELLDDFICISVNFHENLINELDLNSLPSDWRNQPPPTSTQHLGDSWVKQEGSVVLAIPSVLIPGENNYLINPGHPDFSKVDIGAPEPFEFDKRLLKTQS